MKKKKPIQKSRKDGVNINSKPVIFFRIIDVNDYEFFQKNFSAISKEKLDESKLRISYGWAVKGSKTNKTLTVGLRIMFGYQVDEKKVEKIISYTNETVFLIKNFTETISITENSIDIDSKFMMNFISICISTARGILIEKLSNSSYKSLILPGVNNDRLKEIYERGMKKNSVENPS